jgi:hypothetical protein
VGKQKPFSDKQEERMIAAGIQMRASRRSGELLRTIPLAKNHHVVSTRDGAVLSRSKIDSKNRQAAEIILFNMDYYGGPESLMVRWAILWKLHFSESGESLISIDFKDDELFYRPT